MEMNGEASIEAFHGGGSIGVLIARSSHLTNCLDCLSDVMPDLMKRWPCPCFSPRRNEWGNSRMKVASSSCGDEDPGDGNYDSSDLIDRMQSGSFISTDIRMVDFIGTMKIIVYQIEFETKVVKRRYVQWHTADARIIYATHCTKSLRQSLFSISSVAAASISVDETVRRNNPNKITNFSFTGREQLTSSFFFKFEQFPFSLSLSNFNSTSARCRINSIYTRIKW